MTQLRSYIKLDPKKQDDDSWRPGFEITTTCPCGCGFKDKSRLDAPYTVETLDRAMILSAARPEIG